CRPAPRSHCNRLQSWPMMKKAGSKEPAFLLLDLSQLRLKNESNARPPLDLIDARNIFPDITAIGKYTKSGVQTKFQPGAGVAIPIPVRIKCPPAAAKNIWRQ